MAQGYTSVNLIQLGNFTLSSGTKSGWKLVADQFIRDNLDGLVELTRYLVGPFGWVEGVPKGGCLLANSLKPFIIPSSENRLIVEDVLTTGSSMERFREHTISHYGASYYMYRGITVFARGPCPSWVQAVFQMPKALWLGEHQ